MGCVCKRRCINRFYDGLPVKLFLYVTHFFFKNLECPIVRYISVLKVMVSTIVIVCGTSFYVSSDIFVYMTIQILGKTGCRDMSFDFIGIKQLEEVVHDIWGSTAVILAMNIWTTSRYHNLFNLYCSKTIFF